MLNTQKNLPSVSDTERSERLREIFEYLHEVNESVPIIVEGKKDASALRSLGLIGEIIILHNGNSLYDFCDDIAQKFQKVILLMDWDRRGETLYKTLANHLNGHWEEFSSYREILKILCQKDIHQIESIPKLLRRLEGNESPWQ
jgi:5S rRNA maturation endonuclease (ribonuclease M5)